MALIYKHYNEYYKVMRSQTKGFTVTGNYSTMAITKSGTIMLIVIGVGIEVVDGLQWISNFVTIIV